jgi:YidC/Oxa1 family membrane protein insertase
LSFLSTIFNEILYRPIFNGLIFLYNIIPGHDLGIAIIILTIIIRLALFPLFQKSIKAQKEISALQPKIKEIQEKYKKDKEKQARELMALYKEHKVNPMSGCLPILLQLPVFVAFIRVLQAGIKTESLGLLYSFVVNPQTINTVFLGIIDLAKPNIFLAVLAGIAQFVQSKMMAPKTAPQKEKNGQLDFSKALTTQMTYLMPIFIVFIGLKFPAGLPLYWTVITIFGIIQQYFTAKGKKQNV